MKLPRLPWTRAAAAVTALLLCYVIFVLRPHVVFARLVFPFWFLCLFFSLALTAVQVALFSPASRLVAVGWAAFNFLLLLSHGQAMRFSTDAALVLQSARNFLDGLTPFPNYWYVPGLLDFSKDEIFWNYWWSPVATWTALPFLAVFHSAYQAIHFVVYLCLFTGFTGWLRVGQQLSLNRFAKALLLVFLLSYLVAEKVFIFYVVDILPFALSPWFFFGLLRLTDNFRRDPAAVATRNVLAFAFLFGLTYFVKFSFVFSGVGYLALLQWWLVFPLSRSQGRKALGATATFALPLLLTVGLGYWLADVNNVTSQFREYENTPFSPDNILRFKLALLLPGDLFLSASHFPWWAPTRHFFLSAVVIYALAIFCRSRKIQLPLGVLFLALVMIPAVGLLYASIKGNHDGMYVGRYRFSFAPIGFLIFLLPDLEWPRLKQARHGLAAVALLLLLYSSTGPGASLLGIAVRDMSKGPLAGIHQSMLYTEGLAGTVSWLNENRPADSLLATAFKDDEYELLAVLRGRAMALYFPEGCLNMVMKPYYIRHGMESSEAIGAHLWTTTQDRDVYLFLSEEYFEKPTQIAQLQTRFPQVKTWETVHKSPKLRLLKGRALAKTGLHGRLE